MIGRVEGNGPIGVGAGDWCREEVGWEGRLHFTKEGASCLDDRCEVGATWVQLKRRLASAIREVLFGEPNRVAYCIVVFKCITD